MRHLEIFESTYTMWTDGNNDETVLSLNCEEPPYHGYDRDEGKAWFFWFCLPGCLPDSEPFGPYSSEEVAKVEAYSMFTDEEEEV